MQYTTHFNLNLPEGTDVVNPLIQDNPNYSAIDAAMFANKQSVIGSASEVTSGTAHAITRANTDSNYFRFTATSNWTTGDTMTVDGTAVSVYLSDGTTPGTGAYVINTEVLALISGTRVTLVLSTGKQNAAETSYSNLTSGLAASDVQDAIDEISSNYVKRESGYFSVDCTAGTNIIDTSTLLLGGNLPSDTFNKYLYAIINHSQIINSPNTVETDGGSKIIIHAASAQALTVAYYKYIA